jgi:T5SS/PEP-CTERM-associated repeat protein
MHHGGLIIGLLIGIAASPCPSEAQYTTDFQTNIISGVTSNWINNYFIGNTNFADVLLIQNDGVLLDWNGYVGYQTGASNNNAQVSGTHSIWNCTYTVCLGYSSSGNRLMISNGGEVVNGSDGTVGYQSSSSNNSVVITDSGSVWSNLSSLHVGSIGSDNTLVVSNGGKLFNATFYLGDNSNSVNNSILVSGPASTWSGANALYIGYSGARNTCVLSDGGMACNTNGYLGFNSGSSNNNALVEGVGTSWSNNGALYVGYSGSGNILVISNAGNVFNIDAYIGNSSSGSNNSVVVTGAQSVWTGNGRLYVGNNGRDNALVVDGGTVLATNVIVGFNSSASNNTVTVNGGNLVATNALRKASLVLGRLGQGKLVLNNGTVTVDTLSVSNGANSAIEFNSGQLTSGNTGVSNTTVFTIGNGINSATFHLAGGTHFFAEGLWIRTNATISGCGTINGGVVIEGSLSADCGGVCIVSGSVTNYGRIETTNGTLLIFYGPLINHGQITATNGSVRYYSAFENNGSLLGDIQDGGNAWINPSSGKWEDGVNWSRGSPTNWYWCVITNSLGKTVTIDGSTANLHPETLFIDGLTVGTQGSETNILSLSNSGTVTPLQVQRGLSVGSGAKLTINQGSVQIGAFNGKSLAVDGEAAISAAALVATNGPTWIGDGGHGQVTVSNSVLLTREILAGCSTNMSAALTVVGTNSTWNSSSNLFIGWLGGGNELTIANGGQMINGDGYLGYASVSSNNNVEVTGSNSVWSNSRFLRIGYSGAGNRLVISNGGSVIVNRDASVGYNTGSSNNNVLVTGYGSVWKTATNLYVGYSGSANSLTISDGGKLVTTTATVGYASIGNNVLVTDSGSVWSNLNTLVVGAYGYSNSLVIRNGGHLVSRSTYLSGQFSSGNNTVLVTDPGSVWDSWAAGSTLYIGYLGFGDNSLIISNGGEVVSFIAKLGFGTSGTNVLVTGVGSVWSNGAPIELDNGSRMVIAQGGYVICAQGEIGERRDSSSNQVLVTDSGSIWRVVLDLNVGLSGVCGSLVISNGGKVVSNGDSIGYYGEAVSNTARVVSGGIWSNGTLTVGNQGSTSNSLFIVGGSVFTRSVLVGVAGVTPTPCDNLVEMDDGELVVTNNGAGIIEVRRGKFVLNGGTIHVDQFIMTNACAQFVRTGGTLVYGVAVLDPNASAVGDGIPNGWKQQYGLDPFDPNVANTDSDGDGFSNLQEYLAGTDPTNSASAFRITSVVSTGNDILVNWMTGIGRTNALQAAPATVDGGYYTNGFTDIFTVTNAVGSTTNYLDIGAATNAPSRFYRVRLVP